MSDSILQQSLQGSQETLILPRLDRDDAELVAHMHNANRDLYAAGMRAVVCELGALALRAGER